MPSSGSWCVLAGVFGYRARRAVVLNLAISLITLVSALLIRAGTLSVAPVVALLPVVIAMIAGAVSATYLGTAFVHRISEQLLERIILVLLVVVGTGLIVEAFLPQEVPGLPTRHSGGAGVSCATVRLGDWVGE